MKSGPFISLISEAYGLPEKTVRLYDRSLKEAGLLTSGARGVNAPDVTVRDAARMTLAVMTTSSPKAAPDMVKYCRGFSQQGELDQKQAAEIFHLPQQHSIEDILIEMFDVNRDFSEYRNKGFDKSMEIYGELPLPAMRISFLKRGQRFTVEVADYSEFDYVDVEGLKKMWEISSKTSNVDAGSQEWWDLSMEDEEISDKLLGIKPGIQVIRQITYLEILPIAEGISLGA